MRIFGKKREYERRKSSIEKKVFRQHIGIQLQGSLPENVGCMKRNSTLIKSDVNGHHCKQNSIIGIGIKWEYGKQLSDCLAPPAHSCGDFWLN